MTFTIQCSIQKIMDFRKIARDGIVLVYGKAKVSKPNPSLSPPASRCHHYKILLTPLLHAVLWANVRTAYPLKPKPTSSKPNNRSNTTTFNGKRTPSLLTVMPPLQEWDGCMESHHASQEVATTVTGFQICKDNSAPKKCYACRACNHTC